MKKNLLTLLSFLLIGTLMTFAVDPITIGGDETPVNSPYLPVTTGNFSRHSISQQLYLSTELGASAKTIDKLTFYYTGEFSITRSLEVWLMETTSSTLGTGSGDKFVYNSTTYQAGTKVFDGDVTMSASSYDIDITDFEYSGTKNLVITINDKTGSNVSKYYHVIFDTGSRRSFYKYTTQTTLPTTSSAKSSTSELDCGWDILDLYNTNVRTTTQYVNKITFTFAEETVPAPTSPTATDITATSATLGWTAAEGAESYEVRYGTTSGSLGDAINAGDGTSYSLTGLETSTKYYYQIRTKIGDAYSAWTDEANFTTSAHIHNAITFSKWNFSNTLPTSAGNYYLAHDVTLSSDWGPAGSINLCLNGHRVYFGANYGFINGVTVAIYDFDGNGYITSSNTTQTLLVSGSTSLLSVDRDELVLNTAGGRKIIVASNGQAAIHSTIPFADDVNIDVHLTEYAGVIIDAQIERSFTSASYNTICLPFALDNGALKQYFGNDYDLEEFTGASLEDETLNLTFASRTSLVAGKPYLIKPALNVANPTFEAVTLSATSPSSFTSDLVDFHGVFNPTELEGGNHNLLFLGAGNELFYPSTTANIYGFRAYFEVKGAAQKNGIRARIVKKEDMATGFETVSGEGLPVTGKKILRNGQLLIIRDNKTYNAQGQLVK